MITIFADGSSIGNPGPGGWGAIVSFPHGLIKELGGREAHTTNNRMELTAAIEALEYALSSGESATLYTDSSYLINGITKWVHGWRKNGWVTSAKEPVLNKELWEELLTLGKRIDVEWKHSPGHAGIPGNERVDEIANGFARGNPVTLFEGDASMYEIDLSIDTEKIARARAGKSGAKNGKAYSYLSKVGGVVEKHASWADCEARVKGVPGARFKKALSQEDELRILAEWEA